jgi:hypothetical protein
MSDAITSITDILDPEILSDFVAAELVNKVPALMSGVVQMDPHPQIQAGGQRILIPRWKLASTAWQALSESSDMDEKKITVKKEYGVVVRRGDCFTETDLAKIVNGMDPMKEMVRQVSDVVARGIFATQIKVLTGALIGGLASTNVFDATAQEDQSNPKMSIDNAIKAKLLIGENMDDIKYLLCHSKVKGDILALGSAYVNWGASQSPFITGMVPYFCGMEIITSDFCPYTGTLGTTDVVFSSFLLGANSMWLGYQKKVNIEFDRDVKQKKDIMAYDLHFIPHLDGVGYVDGSTENPADTDLATAAYWELCKQDAKLVRAVALISK